MLGYVLQHVSVDINTKRLENGVRSSVRESFIALNEIPLTSENRT